MFNFTSEELQRYVRTALNWAFSALATYGYTVGNEIQLMVIGVAGAIATFIWSRYANRQQAKINEVAKLDVVEKIQVNDKAVAKAGPSEVVAVSGSK